jgi:hypothetical protein
MSNKVLYGNDAVDPEDISILNGEQCINAAGIVKMLCMAAYHQEKGSAGQIKNETAHEWIGAILEGLARMREMSRG